MPRIPGPEAIQTSTNLGPSGPLPQRTSGEAIAAGVADLGAGLERLGQGINAYDQRQQAKKTVLDVSAADAAYARSLIGIKDDLALNNDYETFPHIADERSRDALDTAAEAITDPEARARWIAEKEASRLSFVDGYTTHATELRAGEELATFNSSLDTQVQIATDPTTDPNTRQDAVDAGMWALDRARDTGILTPGDYITKRDDFIKKVQQGIAINHYEQMIATPGLAGKALSELGTGITGGDSSIATAIGTATDGTFTLPPDLAKEVAKDLKDNALPTEPDLQKAYLNDPSLRQAYLNEAVTILTRKLGGDGSAAIIALAPGGSMDMAKAFAKDHDETKLPADVRDFYKRTMGAAASPVSMPHMPVLTAPNVNVTHIQTDLLKRWEDAQSIFGKQVTIISGERTPEHNAEVGGATHSEHLTGNAIDLDVSKMSEAERLRLIQIASSIGFKGIGVYKDSIHLDMGGLRAWGPDYTNKSVPAWAADTIKAHLAGETKATPRPNVLVSPRAAALGYDQRLNLAVAARQAMDKHAIDMRTSVDAVVTDAPAAVADTGHWDGATVTPADFVAAYGGPEGVARYRAFKADMDIAQLSYGFKTSSAAEITAEIAAAEPKGSGPGADIERKRYDQIQKAGQAVLDARKKDPAGYVSGAFANVGKAWEDLAADPSALPRAISMTSMAERLLGIAEPKLLPDAMAEQHAATFNDVTLPLQQRIDAVTTMVAAAKTDEDRMAIFNQLVDKGVPKYVGRAFDALEQAGTDPTRFADAQFLFQAAGTDLSKAAPPRPTDKWKPEDVTNAVANEFRPGSKGYVLYNLGVSGSKAVADAGSDADLFQKALYLHLVQGMPLDQATALTEKQMWGNIKVATGNGRSGQAGFQITLPQDADVSVYQRGFTALLPKVAEALRDAHTPMLSTMSPHDGSLAIGKAISDNYVLDVLQSGYFADIGNGKGYVFINPKVVGNTPVYGIDGKPLVFSPDQVKLAAAWRGGMIDKAPTDAPNDFGWSVGGM